MQIVINLDEDVYTRLFDNGVPTSLADGIVIDRAIRTGKVLPKHGRLCDLDAALKCVDDDSMEDCDAKWQAIRLFDWAMSKRVLLEAYMVEPQESEE